MTNKLLFIMGNGPSLRNIMDNPKSLQIIRENHTFGLNVAYRAYKEYNFYPTYFGCFDYLLNEVHKESFENLILENNNIKEFYLIGSRIEKQKLFSSIVQQNEKFKKFNFINLLPSNLKKNESNLDNIIDMGISSTNAVQIGILKGYKTIILLGCDANYIEKIPEAISLNSDSTTLIINENPKNNPNYWFNEYQLKGDMFKLPQVSKYHLPSWKNISNFFSLNVEIINCSKVSKIPYFQQKAFDEIFNQNNWEKDLIKYPLDQKISDFNYLSSLDLNYLNEILLLPDEIDIKDYFYFKLCKEFGFISNNYKFNHQEYIKIIRSQSFIDKYHNSKNFCIDTLNNLVKYHRENNYYLIKKHDIRYRTIVRSYLFDDNINSIIQDKGVLDILKENKLLTFIMIIKNRNLRAKSSTEYLVNEVSSQFCDFIIVEDKSDDLLNLNDFKYKHLIKHYVVDSKCSWNRSGLLNFGINRCITPYFIAWDCDFYITQDLVFDLKKMIIEYQPKNIVGIQCFDTDICDFGNWFNLPATPYTYLWLYNTSIIKSVGMFNSDFTGWGLEERELEVRVKNKFGLKVIRTDKTYPCFHHSHNNSQRPRREQNNQLIYDNCIKNKVIEFNNYMEYDLIEDKNYSKP